MIIIAILSDNDYHCQMAVPPTCAYTASLAASPTAGRVGLKGIPAGQAASRSLPTPVPASNSAAALTDTAAVICPIIGGFHR
ncbi:hypothetical protein [Bacillus sp. 3255]|uniref:hypothetical protein n=1 Tax=Bacillus sp. 3255 TaxID=2817904 RepID=UPI00286C72FB|nr:hypothetical protein [Bacillus sp. 3255]